MVLAQAAISLCAPPTSSSDLMQALADAERTSTTLLQLCQASSLEGIGSHCVV